MFVFNCYRNWAQLLLHQTSDAPVIILIKEGVTQGYTFSMVPYGINLVPLAEYLRYADPNLLSLFYTNNAVFDGLARRSAVQLKMLMYRGPYRDTFPMRPSHYL